VIIHILGGGPIDLLPDFSPYTDQEIIWVGVDRGVYTLLSVGITPSIAFGDFDSVSHEELMVIEKDVAELKRFKPEKDETDMELAINWAVSQKPEIIRMFGGTGGRLDNIFANIKLLTNFIM
jgi:thiamine pyrophosphokinase